MTRTISRAAWALMCVLLTVSCSKFPAHDNPLDPASPDYEPPQWFDGYACRAGAGDSLYVVTQLVPRAGAPEVRAVWVKLCGSGEATPSFLPLTYDDFQDVWVNSVPAKSTGESLREHNGLPRGSHLDDTPSASGPCWFIVCDKECAHYLVGPVTVRDTQTRTPLAGVQPE